jgi:hypothetical protein
MSEMVERVALAIATLSGDSAMKHNLAEINQSDQFEAWRAMYPVKVTEHDRELARAAIKAMREPTTAMLDTSDRLRTYAEAEWQGMIDAALGLPGDGQ